MIDISSIKIKNKFDLLKVSEILERIGIKIFPNDDTKERCLTWDDIDNNYLLQDDNGWRIQSHLLKERFTSKTLEEFVDEVLERYPTIREDIERYEELIGEHKGLIRKIDEESKRINTMIRGTGGFK